MNTTMLGKLEELGLDALTGDEMLPVSEDGVVLNRIALDDLAEFILNMTSGENGYLRMGSYMVVNGTMTLPSVIIDTSAGGVYYGDAAYGNKNNDIGQFSTEGAFPACFTAIPCCFVQLSGSTSTSWVGAIRADQAGIKKIRLLNGKSKSATDITARYFAIGRCFGDNAAAAAVISWGLQWVGITNVDSQTLGEYICGIYDSFMGTTSGAGGWCSEFASVCANQAGISPNIFPPTSNAYKGSGAFSDIGCWYVRSGTSFVRARVTDSSKEGFAYTLDASGETYVPQIGDVLYTSNVDVNYKYPTHTGLVVSVETSKDSSGNYTTYALYTLEGNLDSTVQRRKRDLCVDATFGKAVFAVGHVEYPTDYKVQAIENIANAEGGAY